MRSTFAAFPLLVGAMTMPCESALAQAATSVHMESTFSVCNQIRGEPPPVIVPGAPSGTQTSQVWIGTVSGVGCSGRGSAFSYLGVVGASAQASMQNFCPQQSLFVKADTTGFWKETVRPGMAARYLTELNVKKLTLSFVIGAAGSVSALGDGGASATIGYRFQFGTASGAGSQNSTANLPPTPPIGDWGTITRTVDIFSNGTGFDPFDFTMSGDAHAVASMGLNVDEVVDANFGTTMVWGGIQNIQAFDGAGNPVPLGIDAKFQLLGETTGFDYVNPAVEASVVRVLNPVIGPNGKVRIDFIVERGILSTFTLENVTSLGAAWAAVPGATATLNSPGNYSFKGVPSGERAFYRVIAQ